MSTNLHAIYIITIVQLALVSFLGPLFEFIRESQIFRIILLKVGLFGFFSQKVNNFVLSNTFSTLQFLAILFFFSKKKHLNFVCVLTYLLVGTQCTYKINSCHLRVWRAHLIHYSNWVWILNKFLWFGSFERSYNKLFEFKSFFKERCELVWLGFEPNWSSNSLETHWNNLCFNSYFD